MSAAGETPETIESLATPALLLDRAVVRGNTQAMTARMQGHGTRLRPHMKTAKSAAVAALATEGNYGGITVSTLAEARYFAAHGFRDILYGVGIVPAKLDAVQAIQESGARVQLITDDVAVARAIGARAAALGARFEVLIEIDTGQHRAGLEPDSADLLAVARVLDEAQGVDLAGVMTHAGQSYHCAGAPAIRAVAEAERAGVVRAAERLAAAGIPCPTVSAGSTPTAMFAETLAGVTEMRPGVYTLFDLSQMGLGACAVGDIAVSVLATVIGHQRGRGHLVIDAGFMALSKDLGASAFLDDVGFGWLVDEAGARLDGLFVAEVNQEHGLVPAADPAAFDRLPLGARVRILPNHACATAAMYDRYHVVDGGAAVVDVWERCAGW